MRGGYLQGNWRSLVHHFGKGGWTVSDKEWAWLCVLTVALGWIVALADKLS